MAKRTDPCALNDTQSLDGYNWFGNEVEYINPSQLLDLAQQEALRTGWDVHYILCRMMKVPYDGKVDDTFDYYSLN